MSRGYEDATRKTASVEFKLYIPSIYTLLPDLQQRPFPRRQSGSASYENDARDDRYLVGVIVRPVGQVGTGG